MGGNAFTSFGVTGPVGGWVELGRTTLGSAATTLGVNGLANKRYYMFLINSLGRSAAATDDAWQPSDSSTFETSANMANRSSRDGLADVTAVSTATPTIGTLSDTTPRFVCGYWGNLSAKEKLMQIHVATQATAGAANVSARNETVGKHAQTSNPLDGMRLNTTNAETYNTGSEIVFLGWDPADVHTTNFWEELASVDNAGAVTTLDSGTFTAKKYLWVQYYIPAFSSFPTNVQMVFNSDDASSNYAMRISRNGGTDSTFVNQSKGQINVNNNQEHFLNMFIINNSANNKLCIINISEEGTAGAGSAPDRWEGIIKWANTSAQITDMTFELDGIATFNAGSKLRVWGGN